MSDPVIGTYQLTACSAGSSGAMYSNCQMTGVVTAPGVGPAVVEHLCTAPTKKWPSPGMSLPVTVDRADPTRLRINWDDMLTGRQQGEQQAQLLASRLAAATGAGAGAGADSTGNPLFDQIMQLARQNGANVSVNTVQTVLGDPGRAAPGTQGGGLTPEESIAAVRDGGASLGLHQATARVLAVYEVPVPPGMPGALPAGLVDLTLDVTTVDGHHFSTQLRMGFSTPDKRATVAAVGTVLPVLADPDRRDRIVVDTNRMS
jgi:hypothetical protein